LLLLAPDERREVGWQLRRRQRIAWGAGRWGERRRGCHSRRLWSEASLQQLGALLLAQAERIGERPHRLGVW